MRLIELVQNMTERRDPRLGDEREAVRAWGRQTMRQAQALRKEHVALREEQAALRAQSAAHRRQRTNARNRSERSCRDVLDDHFVCRERGDLEADLERNYAEDVVVLTPTGCFEGHDGVRQSARLLYEAVNHTDGYEYSSIVTDDRVALLEWHCNGEDMKITDGVDSFLIEDGLIKVQTIRYTVTFADLSQARSVERD